MRTTDRVTAGLLLLGFLVLGYLLVTGPWSP